MKTPMLSHVLTAAVLNCAAAGVLCADQPEDEAAIRKSAESYVVAFNAHDATALAAHWSPQAVYLNPLTGDQVVGRDNIEKQFATIFAELKDAKLEATVESVQFVSPNVAIERGTAHIIRPDTEPELSAYSAVHVKHDGKWLLDRVTEEEASSVPSSYERLKDLEWMIGTWVDEDDQARVEMTCQWAKNQTFLTRSFTISAQDQVEMSGLQIIGWDASAGRVRSWTFDSDGGFGEAIWTKKDNRWIVHAAATLPDGRKTSAINIMTLVDDNSITWESTGRELDGEILPSIEAIKVVRNSASK